MTLKSQKIYYQISLKCHSSRMCGGKTKLEKLHLLVIKETKKNSRRKVALTNLVGINALNNKYGINEFV